MINRFIYFPVRTLYARPSNLNLAYRDVWLTTADAVRIHGWFCTADDPIATILFLHGNAGNISHRLENVAQWVHAGIQVLILDYRGYGRSEGKPGEAGTYQDALAAWGWLRDRLNRPPVIFGRSLGGAVATWLATRPDVHPRALILENTFTSVRDLAPSLVPVPGLAALLPDMYPSLSRVGQLRAPLLVIHAEKDQTIPLQHGRRLYEAAPEPKELYLVPDAHHNDAFLVGGPTYWERILAFIQRSAGSS